MASVTFTIPDEKFDEFKEAFIECHNVPRDPLTHEPTMTENEWIKEWARLAYLAAYRQGRKRVRDKAHPYTQDPEIIT